MAIFGMDEKEYFACGHRACAGCGEALAIRHILKAAGPKTIIAQATGCMEVVSTPYPESSWEVPWVHCAFENASAVASGVRAALDAKGDKETNIIAIGGDGASFDIGFGSLSGALERGTKFLYIATDNEAYMNCLSTDSLIMTKEGLKKITQINVGDEVYAFNQKTHELVLKKCTGVFDNGLKRVYEINTNSNTIKATGNHPFLVLQRNGKSGENTFVWKMVEGLKVGDEIVALKKGLEGKSYYFNKIKTSAKGDYKVNKINEVLLPEKSSPELMKLLGIYVGDGWTRIEKAEVGFALPKEKKGREEAKQLIENLLWSSCLTENENELHLNSINIAKFINSLGFGKGAKNKTIPSWVFTLPLKEKEAFVEGLMLADGYKIGESNRYVSASFELLKTLRLLLQTMDLRVRKIHSQTKEKGVLVVKRNLLTESTYGYVCFSSKKGALLKYASQNKQRNYLFGNEHFETKKIISIEKKGIEPTLDLRVEGEHNFVADGIVVHNTGIQRSGATFPYANTTTSPAGKVIPGKTQPKKPLPFIAAAHGIEYVATASVMNLMDLHKKVKKALSVNGPTMITVFVPCIPGWKIDSSSTIDVALKAFETNVYPLYEIDKGVLKITQTPSEKKKVEEYLKMQGRFKHLTPEHTKKIQEYVNARWKFLEENNGKKIFDNLF
ncbi:MAG: Pyruvate synthase subunit PorB [archaeon ADurb.Bin336]|nr:MAG: Pyruvate synthase subunit PorB [archaeon ADurb.Bin336]